jgi:hypothetical protein
LFDLIGEIGRARDDDPQQRFITVWPLDPGIRDGLVNDYRRLPEARERPTSPRHGLPR